MHTSKNSFGIGFTKINPSPPMSDRERISPYNINTISSIEVMRIN